MSARRARYWIGVCLAAAGLFAFAWVMAALVGLSVAP